MHPLFNFFRHCFFGFLVLLISLAGAWYALGGTQTVPDQYLWTISFISVASMALLWGFLALLMLNPIKVNGWKEDAELTNNYGRMICALLESSHTNDRAIFLRSFVNFIDTSPEKRLRFIRLTEQQKEELTVFCHDEIHQAQLEVSATVPENTERSRWDAYQKACSSTELFSKLDRVVAALK